MVGFCLVHRNRHRWTLPLISKWAVHNIKQNLTCTNICISSQYRECLLTSSTSHLCFDSYLNLSIVVVFRTDRTRSLGFILNFVVITSMSCQWLYFSRFLFLFLFHDSHLFFCHSKTFIYVKKAVVIHRGEKLSFPFVSRCSHVWLHRETNGKLSFSPRWITRAVARKRGADELNLIVNEGFICMNPSFQGFICINPSFQGFICINPLFTGIFTNKFLKWRIH